MPEAVVDGHARGHAVAPAPGVDLRDCLPSGETEPVGLLRARRVGLPQDLAGSRGGLDPRLDRERRRAQRRCVRHHAVAAHSVERRGSPRVTDERPRCPDARAAVVPAVQMIRPTVGHDRGARIAEPPVRRRRVAEDRLAVRSAALPGVGVARRVACPRSGVDRERRADGEAPGDRRVRRAHRADGLDDRRSGIRCRARRPPCVRGGDDDLEHASRVSRDGCVGGIRRAGDRGVGRGCCRRRMCGDAGAAQRLRVCRDLVHRPVEVLLGDVHRAAHRGADRGHLAGGVRRADAGRRRLRDLDAVDVDRVDRPGARRRDIVPGTVVDNARRGDGRRVCPVGDAELELAGQDAQAHDRGRRRAARVGAAAEDPRRSPRRLDPGLEGQIGRPELHRRHRLHVVAAVEARRIVRIARDRTIRAQGHA